MIETDQKNIVLARQADFVAAFARISSWEDRYKKIIEMGKKMPAFPKELYDEKYKVKGCQSQVWLHAELTPNQTVLFRGDSDALIVKGLVALLLETYSDATPSEILNSSPGFLKDLGLDGHLSPSRANGLYAMLKQILYYAAAFQKLSQRP